MMNRPLTPRHVLAACGMVAGLSAATPTTHAAPPRMINISGATLQQNYFTAQSSTNDYIDVDGNGNALGIPRCPAGAPVIAQDLAPPGFANPYPANMWWVTTYRATGSINGFVELVRFGSRSGSDPACPGPFVPEPFADMDSDGNWDVGEPFTDTNGNLVWDGIQVSTADLAFANRTQYIAAGVVNAAGNFANEGGSPVVSVATGSDPFAAAPYTTAGNPGTGTIQIDIAPLDVPSRWAVATAGTPAPLATPSAAGYGANPRTAVSKTGTSLPFGNLLADLGERNLYDPMVTPNEDTIFDTPTAFTPIAYMVNYGVGRQQATYAELRHLFGTGRMPSGENLMAITRDSGSGTRNGVMNSIGLDPTWGVGENIGLQSNLAPEHNYGSAFSPSNKGGSGGMESTVFNVRLGIGYSGAERGVGNNWLPSRCEVLALQADGLRGDGQPGDFVRPDIDSVLDNGLRGEIDPSTGLALTRDGYRVGGPAIIATIGDPRSASPEKGGLGWMEPFRDGESFTDTNGNNAYDTGEPFQDCNGNTTFDAPNGSFDGLDTFNDLNGNAIRDSVEVRPGTLNPAMCNEEAAAYINNLTRSEAAVIEFPGTPQTFFSPGAFIAGTFILVSATDNVQTSTDPDSWTGNAARRQTVQTFTRTNNRLANSAYDAFNTTQTGRNPARNTGVTYTDGVANGANYIDQAGNVVAYAANVSLRNKIAGDMNGDGLRNIDDAADLVAAWRQRTGGPAWVAPDGPGGSAGSTACIEVLADFNCDGNVNAEDVRYWADGLAIATSGPSAGRLDRAAGFAAVDNALSTATGGADNNLFNTTLATGKPYAAGDSAGNVVSSTGLTTRGFAPVVDNAVDANDIDYVFAQFKNSHITGGAANWDDLNEAVHFDLSADITGDLIVDQADVTRLVEVILDTRFGDANLDGRVCNTDRQIVLANLNTAGGWAEGDFNGDGQVTTADLSIASASACLADWDCGGVVNSTDISAFLTAWLASINGGTLVADVDNNGAVNSTDISAFLTAWLAAVNNQGPCAG